MGDRSGPSGVLPLRISGSHTACISLLLSCLRWEKGWMFRALTLDTDEVLLLWQPEADKTVQLTAVVVRSDS